MNTSYEYTQFLVEKILQYVPRPNVRVGDKINFRCPFCGDSKKSATKKRGWVYLSNASYYCFNCGISMSGIMLLKSLSGSDYEAIHREYVDLFLKSGRDTSLSAVAWKPTDEPSVFNVKQILNPDLKKPLSSKATSYLKLRKVLDAPFLREPLFSTYAKEGKEEFILIPWKLNGIDAYYQVNDFLKLHPMKYMFPKGTKKLLYGLDNIDPSYKKVFVFEGVYDSLFVKNGIASGTKSLTDYQKRIIEERWPHHEIVISFDNDMPGFASTMKMVESDTPFKFFMWFGPQTKEKDINERILSVGDINMFSDPTKLDSMVVDKLQMKLWMMQNGKWQKESSYKARLHAEKPEVKRSVFLSPDK